MTNDDFLDILAVILVQSHLDCGDLFEHAKKLVAVAEAAEHTYGATFDEDEGEGDGFYVSWEDYMKLGKSLKELKGR